MGAGSGFRGLVIGGLLLSLLAACGGSTGATTEATDRPATSSTTAAPPASATLVEQLPPVEGADPSYEVAAFYYPWYRTLEREGVWDPWDHSRTYVPPGDIGSDFYPELGPYSSTDPGIVAQHFAWLRRAGVGVIASSWWGPGDFTDSVVPLLLEMGERYGIKVAFHIEPRSERNADQLVEDIRYLYDTYGDSPAIFRTTAGSAYSGEGAKGLFFLWAADFANFDPQVPVEPGYWREAMDRMHALPNSAIVIANTLNGAAVELNHFDGLYNYATPHLDRDGGFGWARGVPVGAWYVPSVLPGFSAERIGYARDPFIERFEGQTYHDQWDAALAVGVKPQMVTITSFNEWLEGTQIEPARNAGDTGYYDYGGLGGDGYLTITRDRIDGLASYTWPEGVAARLVLATTSDWTFVRLVSGGDWIRPGTPTVAGVANAAGFYGDRLSLNQDLAKAEAGEEVQLELDLFFTNLDPDGLLEFQIARGHIGGTDLVFYVFEDGRPVEVGRFRWEGINPGAENLTTVSLSAGQLLQSP